GAAVINADDAFGRDLYAQVRSGCLRIGYGAATHGLSWDGFLHAEAIESSPTGLRVVAAGSYGRADIASPLLGRFNAYNLLAALGALLGAGMHFGSAVERLSRVRPVAGRMEAFGGGDKPLVVVDYAHTPQALGNALSSL